MEAKVGNRHTCHYDVLGTDVFVYVKSHQSILPLSVVEMSVDPKDLLVEVKGESA